MQFKTADPIVVYAAFLAVARQAKTVYLAAEEVAAETMVDTLLDVQNCRFDPMHMVAHFAGRALRRVNSALRPARLP